jgi:hypothetical protein
MTCLAGILYSPLKDNNIKGSLEEKFPHRILAPQTGSSVFFDEFGAALKPEP